MKEKILELLKQSEEYVSGQHMCEVLGVSRTAIWKYMNQLKEEGYEIASVNNRGYKLLSEPDILNEARIREQLHTQWLAKNIVYEKKMDSTNTRAKRLGEEGAVHGTLVVTECQTAGRGRRGHTWVSPEGNCYFTILLRPDVLVNRAASITLIAAMALTRAIRKVTKLEAMIKWPNDVIANGKKLCGILTESSTDLEYIQYVVVGIGINVNQEEFPPEIQSMASSLWLETGQKVSRARLLAAFLDEFEAYYQIFLETEDLSRLVEEYNGMLINCGKTVKVIEKDRERILQAQGIDQTGGLIVETEDGQREVIISGEVSVRGLYGYAQ